MLPIKLHGHLIRGTSWWHNCSAEFKNILYRFWELSKWHPWLLYWAAKHIKDGYERSKNRELILEKQAETSEVKSQMSTAMKFLNSYQNGKNSWIYPGILLKS